MSKGVWLVAVLVGLAGVGFSCPTCGISPVRVLVIGLVVAVMWFMGTGGGMGGPIRPA